MGCSDQEVRIRGRLTFTLRLRLKPDNTWDSGSIQCDSMLFLVMYVDSGFSAIDVRDGSFSKVSLLSIVFRVGLCAW